MKLLKNVNQQTCGLSNLFVSKFFMIIKILCFLWFHEYIYDSSTPYIATKVDNIKIKKKT